MNTILTVIKIQSFSLSSICHKLKLGTWSRKFLNDGTSMLLFLSPSSPPSPPSSPPSPPKALWMNEGVMKELIMIFKTRVEHLEECGCESSSLRHHHHYHH